MKKRKIIIDTDCGSDDAVAIVMALRERSVEVLCFTTVYGNVPLEQATTNTLISIEKAQTYQPPVYRGCSRPILRDVVYAYETHGQDGMGDIGLKVEQLTAEAENGVIKMLELLRSHEEGEIELITLGTLTNVALAFLMEPETMRKVKRIAMMGSAGLGCGNVTPVAEFNIWQDAEAAKIIVDSGIPLLFVGWDACLDAALLEQEDMDKISALNEIGAFCMACNRQLVQLNEERFGRPLLDMADPAAMAAILRPECIKTCDAYYCDVDISQGISYGAVVIDRMHTSGKLPNAEVCSALHGELFKNYLCEVIRGDFI